MEGSSASDEQRASSSSSCESESEEVEDQHVELDGAVVGHINTVLNVSCRDNECIGNRSEQITAFLRGYMKMSKDCQRSSLITVLAMCSGFSEEGQKHRTTGARHRHHHEHIKIGFNAKNTH
ncbi:hypothetical protein F441_20631 [Phytophthora nicotianae CJ01A1]|uniref:Uncharacterized protein n=3 Tax=Phytophthora nicotianae TaxID=4792 RepID=V9DW05_PHYNI|nr:hypothetical protein F443_22680 [Phytophthora nicotianae P1569]ETK75686.1 hypothetical protein L915_17748 [Phytophthora nicotianae]ETP02286.1 hypothetical protein F441_20631 [Phytophthora nicotianae CJ01A1]ETL29118.1 hypothetical protein L916_17648 [Phytophthora nicotianae]ETL82343.1 hypothetical protein L917_17488 [Phytophthora nicotianae]